MTEITLDGSLLLLIGVFILWVFCMGVGVQAEYNIEEKITQFPVEIAYIIVGIIVGVAGTKIIDMYQNN